MVSGQKEKVWNIAKYIRSRVSFQEERNQQLGIKYKRHKTMKRNTRSDINGNRG